MITKWVNMKEHIYHEGIRDSSKSVRRKVPVFGKTTKKAASKAASQAISKVSEHAGEKAGDKIIELLHKKKQDKTPSVQSMKESINCLTVEKFVKSDLCNLML